MAQNEPNLGKPQFSAHSVTEPIFIIGMMLTATYINRRRGYRVGKGGEGLLGKNKLYDSEDLDSIDESDLPSLSTSDLLLTATTAAHPPKERSCMGVSFRTPNSSRYAHHWHSRFLQKFPFLVEFFYWGLNYLFYICAKPLAEAIFRDEGFWQTAENHGIAVLTLEHDSAFGFLFPLREIDVQQFFMTGHQSALTFLNRMYSLIHIPATVFFLSWYYYAAPTHDRFATARRMMTLTNVLSFAIFTVYPCMPPRLLPERFGFYDTVRREDAQSVFAEGKFFNQLAAFPSLHFGYSFCIATVLVYHSGILRRRLERREKRVSKLYQAILLCISVLYPAFLLTIIVATANHYWLDALAATNVVMLAWLCNRVLLLLVPLEDLFLWCVKLEKPIPTTGNRQW